MAIVAATRGFYRYLMIGRRIAVNPADDLQPPFHTEKAGQALAHRLERRP